MAGGWRYLCQVGADVLRRLRQHDVMLMAAAIAFYWLLALIPLLLLGSSALGYFLGSSDEAADAMLAAAQRLLPQATGPEVERTLQGTVTTRHVTGIVGLATLLWVAMSAFDVIINSLTALSGERETRPFLRRRLIALILVGTAGLLLAIALTGNWLVAAWPNIQTLLGVEIVLPAFLTAPAFPRYATTLLMALLLTIIYHLAPLREIGWPAAVTGGVAGALLWHGTKLALNWFRFRFARIVPLFGVLTGFIVLVVWIFSTALILLVAGVLAEVVDRRRQARLSEAK